MPKYDGSLIYSEQLTNYEESYCQNRIAGMTQRESYKKAYINIDFTEWNPNNIDKRASKLETKERIIKRLNELRELKKLEEFNGNQTQAEPFENFEKSPKRNIFYLLFNFMNDCKSEGKRAEQFKAIESIAKLYNLYSDGSITNNQLNQIVINAPDVNSAIDSIHNLVNKTAIKQIQTKN